MKKGWRKKLKRLSYVTLTLGGIAGILYLFVQYYLFPDPFSAPFQKLKDGMSQAEVLKIVNEHCPKCDFVFEKDDRRQYRVYGVFLSEGGMVDSRTRELLGGYRTQYGNTSSLWLQFDDGWLRDAEHFHNMQLILNYPPVEGENTDFRGYAGTTNECLTKDCGRNWKDNFHFLTGKEHIMIQKAKENSRKNKWWLCQKTKICF